MILSRSKYLNLINHKIQLNFQKDSEQLMLEGKNREHKTLESAKKTIKGSAPKVFSYI